MAEIDLAVISDRANIARQLFVALTEEGFDELQAMHLLPSMLAALLPMQLPKPPER